MDKNSPNTDKLGSLSCPQKRILEQSPPESSPLIPHINSKPSKNKHRNRMLCKTFCKPSLGSRRLDAADS